MNSRLLLSLLSISLAFVYGIFMILYLNDAKKCDQYLSNRDQTFRKAAVVITWIDVVLSGIAILSLLILLASGSGSMVLELTPLPIAV